MAEPAAAVQLERGAVLHNGGQRQAAGDVETQELFGLGCRLLVHPVSVASGRAIVNAKTSDGPLMGRPMGEKREEKV